MHIGHYPIAGGNIFTKNKHAHSFSTYPKHPGLCSAGYTSSIDTYLAHGVIIYAHNTILFTYFIGHIGINYFIPRLVYNFSQTPGNLYATACKNQENSYLQIY